MTRKVLVLAAAALLAAGSAKACDTSDVGTAWLDYQIARDNQIASDITNRQGRTDYPAAFAIGRTLDARVSAALSHCRRGELISVPNAWVKRYCDFGKHVEHESDGLASCVKS